MRSVGESVASQTYNVNTSKTFYCIVLILVVVRSFRCTLSLYYIILDMHPLAAASRSRLLETEPQLFVFETSYYAFCGRYCCESFAPQK